jgi:hypothetical protein
MLNNIENKGEFGDLKQIKPVKNCAIRDTVAQLKMKRRSFVARIAAGALRFDGARFETRSRRSRN